MPEPCAARRAAARVLIISDQPRFAENLAGALRNLGHACTIVPAPRSAAEATRRGCFDVVIAPGRRAQIARRTTPASHPADLLILRWARRALPGARVIVVEAHGDVAATRAAFKSGAFDVLDEPVDLDDLGRLVADAAEASAAKHAPDSPVAADAGDLGDAFGEIIATSTPMRQVLRKVQAVASLGIPVLITGETGTGKELIARAIHRIWARGRTGGARDMKGPGGRFVAVNCAAEVESLLEDQLFGHVRGAFTGAQRDREGMFEYANKGTLFLDEIGSMPLAMQAKPLRVLESGELVRLGSNQRRRVEVRVLSATNQDLGAMVAAGTFREELYFRIKGVEIRMPPLRDRPEDIPGLVLHAVGRFARCTDGGATAPPDIAPVAMARLVSHPWPGNVRQLLSVVQHMMMVAARTPPAARGHRGGVLEVHHLPDDFAPAAGDRAGPAMGDPSHGRAAATMTLDQLEKRAIRETLQLTRGNREKAAGLLGIGQTTLYRKLKAYGIR